MIQFARKVRVFQMDKIKKSILIFVLIFIPLLEALAKEELHYFGSYGYKKDFIQKSIDNNEITSLPVYIPIIKERDKFEALFVALNGDEIEASNLADQINFKEEGALILIGELDQPLMYTIDINSSSFNPANGIFEIEIKAQIKRVGSDSTSIARPREIKSTKFKSSFYVFKTKASKIPLIKLNNVKVTGFVRGGTVPIPINEWSPKD